MMNMYQSRIGEFQECELKHYFTFGDLQNCPDSFLMDWAKTQEWYDQSQQYSFIDVGDVIGSPYRIAIIKKTVAYVLSGDTEEFQKWNIKKMITYRK